MYFRPQMRKGDLLTNLHIDTMASEGKCIARHDGQVVFLKGGAPGDTVEAQLTKIKSQFLEATVTRVLQPSPDRTEPVCGHFGTCGGCSWQHINYETQLHYKQKQVKDNLERIGGLKLPDIKPIIPSQNIFHYRNRLDFTFTANRWLTREELSAEHPREPGLGFHIPRMYDKVFDVKECHLQADPSNAIRLLARSIALQHDIPFFDLQKQVGFLRSLTIRTASTGETMIILQVTYDKMEWIEKILKGLDDEIPNLTSINYVINGKRNDTFADLDVITWKGTPYITESMPALGGGPDLKFRVGPKSFYQTNSQQAHTLYRVAADMADLRGSEVVYDLYTGTGTIANFVARQPKKVIGLEYVAAAIEDAGINAQLNGIDNTEFFAGDIKDLLNESFLQSHGRPDVIITDPPRVGMHEDVTRMLVQAGARRIVYVSCNPATQARDLKVLCEHYTISAIQPVDMFPHTMHVENVVCLDRK